MLAEVKSETVPLGFDTICGAFILVAVMIFLSFVIHFFEIKKKEKERRRKRYFRYFKLLQFNDFRALLVLLALLFCSLELKRYK